MLLPKEIRDEFHLVPGSIIDIKKTPETILLRPVDDQSPLMVKEGVLDNPKVDVMMGLHINSQTPVGVVTYKPMGTLAAADRWVMNIKGKQSHGSAPGLDWPALSPLRSDQFLD